MLSFTGGCVGCTRTRRASPWKDITPSVRTTYLPTPTPPLHTTPTTGLILAAAGAALQPPRAIWARVTHALGCAPFSRTTYTALLDTLVGRPQSVTLDPSALPASRVCHAPLLGTVLELLPKASLAIQRQALEHLTQLCAQHAGNCDAVLNLSLIHI